MEVLPNSMQLMAKAAQRAGLSTNGTIKEMLALQTTGSLISSKVLPHFSDLLHEAAVNNGGLENAMLSNRVAMNRMATSAQVAADTIFKSGWGKGLTKLFNSTAEMIKENEVFFKSFGVVIESVFNAVSHTITYVIAPAFSALGSTLNMITSVFGTTGVEVGIFAGTIIYITRVIKTLTGAFRLLGVSIAWSLWPIIGIGLAAAATLAILEELAEFLFPTGKKTILGINIDDLPKVKSGKLYHSVETPIPSNLSFNKQASAPPISINNQVEVNLNAEQVGRAIAPTEAVKSAFDARYGVNSNY